MPLEEKYLQLLSSFLPTVVGEKERERFSLLYDRVVETNNQINITSLVSPIDVTLKHFLDSLTLFMNDDFLESIKNGKKVCDIGCGGGFPGLPVALIFPDTALTMIDSTEKKIAALKENAKILGLDRVIPVWGRGEELAGAKGGKYREKFDLCVSRAVASLPVLCELCLPFVRVGGTFYAMKGMKAYGEVEEAKKAIPMLGGSLKEIQEIRFNDAVDLSAFDDEEKVKIKEFISASRFLVVIKKNNATSPVYPRKWSQIIKKTL